MRDCRGRYRHCASAPDSSLVGAPSGRFQTAAVGRGSGAAKVPERRRRRLWLLWPADLGRRMKACLRRCRFAASRSGRIRQPRRVCRLHRYRGQGGSRNFLLKAALVHCLAGGYQCGPTRMGMVPSFDGYFRGSTHRRTPLLPLVDYVPSTPIPNHRCAI